MYQENFEKKLNAALQIQRTMRGFLGRELFQDEVDRQESDIWRKIKDGNVTQVEDLFKGFGKILAVVLETFTTCLAYFLHHNPQPRSHKIFDRFVTAFGIPAQVKKRF